MTKVCNECGVEKGAADFYVVSRRSGGRKGLSAACKPCHGERRKRARARARALHGYDVWHAKNAYGVTREQYEALLAKQAGVCAICGEPPGTGRHRGFVIDHDHATARIRGLLHRECNSAIGLLRDDPALLRAAIAYLERSGPM